MRTAIGLIAGPLTWDHYTVWALIPLVLIVDVRRWSRCTGVEVAGLVTTMAAAMVLLPLPAEMSALPPTEMVRMPHTSAHS